MKRLKMAVVMVTVTMASMLLAVAMNPTLAVPYTPRPGRYSIRATSSYETGPNALLTSLLMRYSNWTASNFRIDNSFMSYPYGPSPTMYVEFGYFNTKVVATEMEGYRVVSGTFDATVNSVRLKAVGAPFIETELISADAGTGHVEFQRPIEEGPRRGEFAWMTAKASGNVRVFIPLGSADPPIGKGDTTYFGPKYTFELVLVEPRYIVHWWDEVIKQDIEGPVLELTVPKSSEREAWVHVLWDAAEVDWKNGVHLSCEFKGGGVSGPGEIPVRVQTNEGFGIPEDWPYQWFGHPPAPCRIPITVTVNEKTAPGTYHYVLWAVDDYSEKKYPSPENPLMLTVTVVE